MLRNVRVPWEGRTEDKHDDVILSELHVGTVGAFEAAGFTEVSRPTIRRAVMRVDF